MDEQELYERLKGEFNPPLSPTLITTLLFDLDPSDPSSLSQIEDTLRVLAHSAQQEQQQQQFYDDVESPAGADGEQQEEDEEGVQRALEEWSLSSRSTFTDKTGSTDATSVDGGSGGVGEDTNSSRKFLETLFPHMSPSTLQQALDEDPTADLEDVVEYLLSIESIREAEERGGTWEGDGAAAALQWENMSQDERDQLWEGNAELDDLDSEEAAATSSSRNSSYAGMARSSLRLETSFQEVSPRKKKKKQPTSTKTTLNSLPFNQSHTRSSSPASSSRSTSRLRQNAVASTSSSASSPRPTYLPHLPPSTTTNNHWATLDSLSLTLSALLPSAPPSLFSSSLHSPSHPSTHAALLSALTHLGNQFSDGDDGPRPDMLLEILFGDEDDAEQELRHTDEVEVVWKACRGDLSTALDVWEVMREVEGWGGYKEVVVAVMPSKVPLPESRISSPLISPSNSPRLSTRRPLPSSNAFPPLIDSPSSVNTPLYPSHLFSSNGAFTISPATASSSTDPPLSSTPSSTTIITNGATRAAFPRRPLPQKIHNLQNKWNPTGKDGKGKGKEGGGHRLAESIPAYARQGRTREGRAERWEELREKEMLERGLRNEALRAATRHFQSGTAANQGGSIAAHYAETARKLSDTTRRLGLDAAKAQLLQQHKYTTTYIDLHGLTAYQALSIVREAVHSWWDTRTTTPPSPVFTIITGVGRHSPGQRAVLAPAVAKMLLDDGWKISRGQVGTILVLGAA
ncbi:hypothetical protein BDY24DRAFT_376372 [Mrakia frigida]|uniref:uncharacterized protein n=1 Tax=Mrakia frigida TaxID=29902 RepID=UPI003FCBFF63